jgi:multiple sugar transport system substrate-binding protein
MPTLVDAKVLEPAPDWMIKKLEEEFVPGAKELCVQGDGVIYGPTHEFGIHLPIFNLDMLEKYNLKPPKTWEELVEIDKQMTIVEGGVTKQAGFAFFPKGGWIALHWVGVLYAYGEKVLTSDMKAFAANTERGIKSLETYVSLCHPDLCPDEFATHEAFTKQLIAGEDFISLTRAYVKEGPYPNIRIMTPGPLEQYVKKTQSYAWFYVVPKMYPSDIKEIVWDIIDFHTDPEQDMMMADLGYLPMLKKSLEKFKEDEFIKAFVDAVPYTEMYPPTSKWPAIESVIVAQVGRAIAKEITPEQALATMEEQINSILGSKK